MRLVDNVVFVTDADSDSGKAIVERFAREGARFILGSASGGAAIQDELERLRGAGISVFVTAADLCSTADVEAALDEAARQVGDVDVLIHNNNLVRPTSVETSGEDEFLAILRANAKSAFICTQAVGRRMKAKQSGRVIYVSSIHAEKPTGSSFAYSASKGAVKMLSKEMSLILGRYGVTVNTIEMGPVEGDNERFASEISTLYEDYVYKVPNAVLGDYGDLAGLALYLASDDARYVNGADVRLDGGFLNHYMDFRMKKPAEEV